MCFSSNGSLSNARQTHEKIEQSHVCYTCMPIVACQQSVLASTEHEIRNLMTSKKRKYKMSAPFFILQILPIFVLLLESMMYHTTLFGGGFLVTHNPITKPMHISSSCCLPRNLCLLIGSSSLAPWAIPSAKEQSESKQRCFVAQNLVSGGLQASYSGTLTLFLASHLHWTHSAVRVSIEQLLSTILSSSRRLSRRKEFLGKISTTWTRKVVSKEGAESHLQRSTSYLGADSQSTKHAVETLSWSLSLNVISKPALPLS